MVRGVCVWESGETWRLKSGHVMMRDHEREREGGGGGKLHSASVTAPGCAFTCAAVLIRTFHPQVTFSGIANGQHSITVWASVLSNGTQVWTIGFASHTSQQSQLLMMMGAGPACLGDGINCWRPWWKGGG